LPQSIVQITLNNTLRPCSYFLTSRHISTIQPQQATGHKKCIFDNVEDGFDDIVHRAGALQQGVINEGFFAGFAQQAPARVLSA